MSKSLLVLTLASLFASAQGLPWCGATPAGAASTSAYTTPGSCEYTGYAPGSDVVPHASLDLDQKAFEAATKVADYTTAKNIYTNGAGNSKKSSGANRNLKTFSTSAGTLMANQDLFKTYKAYWELDYGVGNADDYADKFVTKALDATTLPWADAKARGELAKKGSAYQNVWMYVVRELEDAIDDCNAASPTDNDAGVHAWDEGWAFYAGSQNTVASSDGYMVYNLAQKRCGNFGTCAASATGLANSNNNLLQLFTQGRTLLTGTQANCTAAKALIKPIIAQMTVPLVQGTLRYAYKSDLWKNDQRATKCAASIPELAANKGKEIAEGWAFAAAVLPQLHQCDATKAKMIRDNLDIDAPVPVKDTYSKVYHTMYSMLPCLGLTCADIGGLLGTGATVGGKNYYPGATPCTDATVGNAFVPDATACPAAPTTITPSTGKPWCGATPVGVANTSTYTGPKSCDYTGYLVGSDVTAHASLDLDQKAFEAAIKVADYTTAKNIYTNGAGNSKKSSGANRNLKTFSTSAGTLMANQDLFKTYKAYWELDYGVGNADDYADKFVTKALDATTAPWNDVKARAELAKKGSAYQNVWMYVVRELEDAIDDCIASAITDNDAGVHAWDEGWAFYSGSQNTVANANGYMIYNLAQKRCGNFGTCQASTKIANSNVKLLDLFSRGRDLLTTGKCAEAKLLIKPIIAQMTVPLIQGTLRYTYKSDLWKNDQRATKCTGSVAELAANKGKEIAEGWAFAAAVLPQLHAIDATKAKMIRDNIDIDKIQPPNTPVKDTYSKIYHTVHSMLPSLGLTCADIGGLVSGSGYYPGTEPCDDTKAPRDFVQVSGGCPSTTGTTTGSGTGTPTKVGAGAQTTYSTVAVAFTAVLAVAFARA